MKWIALFSQTGTEIVELSKRLGRLPDEVLRDTNVNEEFINNELYMFRIMEHDNIVDYLGTLDEDVLITLHGYLRILPELPHTIYNGHPALCHRFPELKGYNPQEKTWTNIKEYPIIGSIIHEVTDEVDGGQVVKEVVYTNRVQTKEELFDKLSLASLQCWLHFMRDKLDGRSDQT